MITWRLYRQATGTVRRQPAVLAWFVAEGTGPTRDRLVAWLAGRVMARRQWTGDRRAAAATWRRSLGQLTRASESAR